MENQNDGNGTHWVVMKYGDDEIIYCDSMGFYPPIEVMQKAKSNIIYNSKQIQDINATSCGWFCIAFTLNDSKNPNMSSETKFKRFINMFCNDTRKNDGILKQFLQQ